MKRARGLDPDVGGQIVQALVVKCLSLWRRGCHFFMYISNIPAENDRALENLTRNPADGFVILVTVVLCPRQRRKKEETCGQCKLQIRPTPAHRFLRFITHSSLSRAKRTQTLFSQISVISTMRR